jgi:glycosyltransferase involved in cell wall biosynthesis
MNEGILISVIVTVYNGRKFIEDCIDSILSQSFCNFELIIVDDGSIDDTLNIIYKYSDSRILVIENKINRGQSYSRNMAITLSKGRYIAIMDSDDIMYFDRLSLQLEYIISERCNVCFGWVDLIDDMGRLIGSRRKVMTPLLIKAKLLFECPLVHPTAMWNKQFFIDNNLWYNEEFIYAQDMDLWNRVSKLTEIHMMNETLVMFRCGNPESISNAKRDLQDNYRKKISQNMLDDLGYFGIYPFDLNNRFKRLLAIIKIFYLFKGNFGMNEEVKNYFRELLPNLDFLISYRFKKTIKNLLLYDE